MKKALLSMAWVLRLAAGLRVLDALLLTAGISLGLSGEPESEAGGMEAMVFLLPKWKL